MREDAVICAPLAPFIKPNKPLASLTKLQFHMLVMRWKCSLLTCSELATLRDWIGDQKALNDCPWAMEANEYEDDQLTENRHLQRLVVHPLPPCVCY